MSTVDCNNFKGFSMFAKRLLLGCVVGCLVGCGGSGSDRNSDEGLVSAPAEAGERVVAQPEDKLRIAFGSCADDDAPNHPVWDALVAAQPDAVIMAGDNVYADTEEMRDAPSRALLRAQYEKLAATPGFAALRASTPMFATWDDHDYGVNDGGADYAFRTQSEAVFEEFWGYTAQDEVQQREGVYAERRFRQKGIDVQILLLDTRSFRGPLRDASRNLSCPLKNYEKNTVDSFLGDAQWSWLEQRLQVPADLRLLVSSQQVIADQHCFEKWGNFPHERERLFRVIRDSGVQNLVLLSGDRHLGELSILPASNPLGVGYDLLEATSSPLSARSGFGWGETNDYRVSGDNLRENQFGMLEIALQATGAERALEVSAQLLDAEGVVQFQHLQRFELN